MNKYAIKVMSCSRRGRIKYVSSELLQNLMESLEKDDMNPGRMGMGFVDLGYIALDNGYYARALELFRKALDQIIPHGDMRRMRLKALERNVAFRAAEGVDAIWRRMGTKSGMRKDIKEFFSELHYLRLGLDYSEILW